MTVHVGDRVSTPDGLGKVICIVDVDSSDCNIGVELEEPHNSHHELHNLFLKLKDGEYVHKAGYTLKEQPLGGSLPLRKTCYYYTYYEAKPASMAPAIEILRALRKRLK